MLSSTHSITYTKRHRGVKVLRFWNLTLYGNDQDIYYFSYSQAAICVTKLRKPIAAGGPVESKRKVCQRFSRFISLSTRDSFLNMKLHTKWQVSIGERLLGSPAFDQAMAA